MTDPALAGAGSGASAVPSGQAPVRSIVQARNAVAAIFLFNGLTASSWVSRIPAARVQLHLAPGQLGLLLLCPAIGSLLALPLAGQLVLHLGTRRTCAVFAVVCSAGVATAGIGVGARVAVLAGVGLFAFGLGTGVVDVAMNVEAAAVEQRLGRSIMPRFHAGWSVGGVFGALVGAAVSGIGVPVPVHLAVMGAIAALASLVAVRWYLADAEVSPATAASGSAADSATKPEKGAALRAWRERRTLLIGLLVLCAALTEGIANDWLGLSVVDGYHQRQWVGALAYGFFVGTMTLGRTFGTSLIDRVGRVVSVRLAVVAATIGVLLVVVGPWLAAAFLGALFWGSGAALGFPLGMSAAADDPAHSPPRVSVVASIGYVAFLAGPPLVGFVADGVGIRRAVAVVFAALVVLALLAPVLRPLGLGGTAPSGNGDGALTS